MKWRGSLLIMATLAMAPAALANHFGLFFSPVGKRNVVLNSGSRNWSDGSFAASCGEYKNPTNAARYQYTGATGDGYYTVDNGGGPNSVFCYMTPPSVTFVAGNNYEVRKKPSTNQLQIVNLTTSSIFQDDIGQYLNDANNTEVCYLPYTNFILPAGSTFFVADSCQSLVLDVQNNFTVNGNINAQNSTSTGGTYKAIDAAGTPHTHVLTQAAGGAGGQGGYANTVSVGTSAGGAGGSNVNGGGGGGGGGSAAVWYMCSRSGGGGGSARSGGGGGGGTNCNDTGFGSNGGSGGSGGAYGLHGQSLYIQVAGIFSGSGLIGASGFNGSSGNNGGGASCDSAWQLGSGGGGGGGGGAGGSGGTIYIRYKNLGTLPTISANAGGGGAPGGGGGACAGPGGGGGGGSTGTTGSSGSAGLVDVAAY